MKEYSILIKNLPSHLNYVSTLPRKTRNNIKHHILTSMFTMLYYTTVNTSQRVSSNVYYRLCSKCAPFALLQAVRRRCHAQLASLTSLTQGTETTKNP